MQFQIKKKKKKISQGPCHLDEQLQNINSCWNCTLIESKVQHHQLSFLKILTWKGKFHFIGRFVITQNPEY